MSVNARGGGGLQAYGVFWEHRGSCTYKPHPHSHSDSMDQPCASPADRGGGHEVPPLAMELLGDRGSALCKSTAPGKSIVTMFRYVTCWVAQMGLSGFKIKEGHKVKWEGKGDWRGVGRGWI